MANEISRKPQAVAQSSAGDVAAFLKAAKELPAGARRLQKPRLIFSMDATGSRQPTWDMAVKLQGDMLKAAGESGLEVALGYFRGSECKLGKKYFSDVNVLSRLMNEITCQAGTTQISKLMSGFISHTKEDDGARVGVFVGDSFEESAELGNILARAKELKKLGFRLFMFQEGTHEGAEQVFRQIAETTGGLHARFDNGAADQLRELMGAVASYASASAPSTPALTTAGSEFQRKLRALPPPAL